MSFKDFFGDLLTVKLISVCKKSNITDVEKILFLKHFTHLTFWDFNL